MAARNPLTLAEKERIYNEKLRGRSLPAIAADLGCALETVRKWWRIARDNGRVALRQSRRGRAPTGALSRFPPAVLQQALAYKRAHPSWGPDRIRAELALDSSLAGLPLPSRGRLAVFFKTNCPELLRLRQPPPAPAPAPPTPTAVHECWQLDFQEAILLADGQRASICTIRDPLGAAILASRVLNVTGGERGRRWSWEEARDLLRATFTRWETLPDALQTDNEACLGGQATDPLPSRLTLWLVGLGVQHRFIRPNTPTDQAEVERTHRTLDGFVGLPNATLSCEQLQHRLDSERELHNRHFASRASDCGGRPPLVAHPELLRPRRRYQPDWERALFDEERVYAYLATIPLSRKVSSKGQIQLGGRSRSVGSRFANQTVTVRCEAASREWVVTDADGVELKRLPIEGLDTSSLTGVPAEETLEFPPIQLTLPLAA